MHTRRTFFAYPFLLLVLVLAACGGPAPAVVDAVLSVTVSTSTNVLTVGDTVAAAAVVEVRGEVSTAVTWSTSDAAVATVSEAGLIAGVGAGSATITATSTFDDTQAGSLDIVVTAPDPAVLALEIVLSDDALFVGDQRQATPRITTEHGADATVAWSSSDIAVLTVSAEGLVTATGPGEATLTVASVAFPEVEDSLDLVVGAHPLAGRSVLYYVDMVLGTDIAGAALATAVNDFGLDLTVAASEAELVTEIGNAPDLVVFLMQDFPPSVESEEAIVEHVATGGFVVFGTWDVGSTAAQSILTALGSGFDGTENHSTMNIVDASLLTGLAGGVLTVTNPASWGTFSVGLTADDGSEVLAEFEDGEDRIPAIVVGNEGSTAALGFLSDTLDPVDGEQLYLNLFSLLMRQFANR